MAGAEADGGDGAVRLAIRGAADVERARRAARTLAQRCGFSGRATEEIVLCVSELAVNLVRYAQQGELVLRTVTRSRSASASSSSSTGVGEEYLAIRSEDTGPGIRDVALALEDGFSTGGGLGEGLPAVRRLMDELEIQSTGQGTWIEARKWLTRC